jgi:putative transposase
MMKKHYTSSFKVKCVLELLREEKTFSQVASESGVHPTQLRNWRDHVLREIETLFDKNDSRAELIKNHQAEKEELFAQIGRLTTQLGWLKKKSGLELPSI